MMFIFQFTKGNMISDQRKFFYQNSVIVHQLFYVGLLSIIQAPHVFKVLLGPVVKCLTRNPGVLGLSHTGSSGFFCGSVLGQETSKPSLVLVKPRKDVNNVSCRPDMTEILLKDWHKTPFNQSTPCFYIYLIVDLTLLIS